MNKPELSTLPHVVLAELSLSICPQSLARPGSREGRKEVVSMLIDVMVVPVLGTPTLLLAVWLWVIRALRLGPQMFLTS